MNQAHAEDQSDETTPARENLQEATFWQDDGWNAKVIKNEDDEGWAVEITKDGNPDPVLVAPWTMGRDKKNPKPLDANSFYTWIKTAAEVLGRHEQQLHAKLNKSVKAYVGEQTLLFELTIVPDDDEPVATLRATDPFGDEVGKATVPASFKLTADSAREWAAKGFKRIGMGG